MQKLEGRVLLALAQPASTSALTTGKELRDATVTFAHGGNVCLGMRNLCVDFGVRSGLMACAYGISISTVAVAECRCGGLKRCLNLPTSPASFPSQACTLGHPTPANVLPWLPNVAEGSLLIYKVILGGGCASKSVAIDVEVLCIRLSAMS